MEMLNQKQKFIVIIVIIIVIGIIIYYYINSTKSIYENNADISFSEENEVETNEIEEIKEKIVVHITGAVQNNGIVKVDEDSRINDVVEAAGGLTEDADLDRVNLAYKVEDGQKIYIPRKEEAKENTEENIENEEINNNEIISDTSGEGVIENENTENYTTLVNINTADIEKLKELPGIGESTATKIIEYRKQNGKFKTIEDIKNVSGIGDAKFNSIKDFICI